MRKVRYFLWLGLLAALPLGAAVRTPAVFGDSMVLQRNRPLPVWGWAEPGEAVKVTLGESTAETVADASGRWRVTLPARPEGGPCELTVAGENTLRFKDVMIGEVWLCSGQSNMAWRLNQSEGAEQAIRDSANPRLRLFQVERHWGQVAPEQGTGRWRVSSPESSGTFSGVGYFFGRRLAAELEVTVGLIDVSWGGTRIEPWISPAELGNYPQLAELNRQAQLFDPASAAHRERLEQWLAACETYNAAVKEALARKSPPPLPPKFPAELRCASRDDVGMLFRWMIRPLTPLAVGGTIWYQGEANRLDGPVYAEKLKALASGWRREFASPEMPFYLVQLAPFAYARQNPVALASVWAAQSRAAREIPNAGMAVINDVGNLRDIHPVKKRPVGERLAGLALRRTFGREVPAEFPEPESWKAEGGEAVVTFRNAAKLATRDGRAPDWFELCDNRGIWHAAAARLDGCRVILSAPDAPEPKAVRFAWSLVAEPNLVNEHGLPAGIFQLGEAPLVNPLSERIPEAAGFQVLYRVRPLEAASGHSIRYAQDRTESLSGKIERVAYFLRLRPKKGEEQFVYAEMDPFSPDPKKLGVPVRESGARFQQDVRNVRIISNVPGVENGLFPEGCSIEFWDCNYSGANVRKLPGASDGRCDFGDRMNLSTSPGYGSMQLHNHRQRRTVFAYNHWSEGASCDLGIGNAPAGHPDWTGSKSGRTLSDAELTVLVRTGE